MGVELGIWQGSYLDVELPWLRWWEANGRLLPSGWEQASLAEGRAELAEQQVHAERQRAEAPAKKLRRLGVDPDAP